MALAIATLPFSAASRSFSLGIVGLRDLVVELLVGHGVDAADEEARDARDMGGIAALGDVFFQALQIGFRDLQIDLLREQQRDVDADAFADQLLDRGQAFRRGRHLDHQILAVNVLPEFPALPRPCPWCRWRDRARLRG